MDNNERMNLPLELIGNAKTIGIFPSKVGGADAFAAGVGLYYALKDMDKQVALIYPGNHPEGAENLIKPEDVVSNIGERELVIAIDYTGTSASKVHYSTENDILYLSVSPITKDFDLNRVKAKIKGFNYDLIITIGAQVPEDLGSTYTELRDEFSTSKVINIDNTDRNQRFALINVVDSSQDSLSLLALNKTFDWKLKVNPRTAKAFLTGITYRRPN